MKILRRDAIYMNYILSTAKRSTQQSYENLEPEKDRAFRYLR